jgi:hypothetical protein
MRSFRGTDLPRPASYRVEELRREARDSAALVLVTLAIVVVMSFVGGALS